MKKYEKEPDLWNKCHIMLSQKSGKMKMKKNKLDYGIYEKLIFITFW